MRLWFYPTRWPDIDFLFCIRCERRRTHNSDLKGSFECQVCKTRREL